MGAFEALADPVRRRMVELLGPGEQSAGALAAAVGAEFATSQPGASQHLKVLREHGLVRVRAEGTRRWYAIDPAGLAELDRWLDQVRRGVWAQPLDALGTEIARGRRERRAGGGAANRQAGSAAR